MATLRMIMMVSIAAFSQGNPQYSQYHRYYGDHPSYAYGPSPESFNTFHQGPSGVSPPINFLSFGQQPQNTPNPAANPEEQGCGTPPNSCPPTVYRSLDGSCNNFANPGLGIPQSRYSRLLPANYGDGISSPTLAKSGRDLPSARAVSLAIYPDVPIKDPKFTLANMQYGQIITHDMSMVAGSTQSTPHQTQCCTDDGQLLQGVSIPDHCYPILLPRNDPILSATNATCMNFVRTITDRDRQNCPVAPGQPAEQLTAVNHWLDLSIIYGVDVATNAQLRAFSGGLMRVVRRRGHEWLPQNPNVTGTCPGVQSLEEPCYLTGDTRVNQNPQLTQLHILFVREHNRLARHLAAINPSWDDERLYQEARRINIAQHQFITYYEWLPIFLGVSNSLKNGIVHNTKDFARDYDASIDGRVLNEHATAAFRFFHALIAGNLDLVTDHRDRTGSLRLSDWLNRPAILEEGDNFDLLLRGLATQPEEKSNQFHTSEVTQFLFRLPGAVFGTDLKAADIQRNRDHGLASYNDYRQYCGLPRAFSFEDFSDYISIENIKKLRSLYESHEDIELTVGASLERLVPGTLAGPTFLCILTEQFYRTRVGDRFFFENGNPETGLDVIKLNEIRKTSMARLMCDNGDSVRSMQAHAFEKISHDNVVVPCERLPAPDLSAWTDTKATFGLPDKRIDQSQFSHVFSYPQFFAHK